MDLAYKYLLQVGPNVDDRVHGWYLHLDKNKSRPTFYKPGLPEAYYLNGTDISNPICDSVNITESW